MPGPRKQERSRFCDGTYREYHDDADVHALHVHASAYAKFGSLCLFHKFPVWHKKANPGAEKRCEFPGSFFLPGKKPIDYGRGSPMIELKHLRQNLFLGLRQRGSAEGCKPDHRGRRNFRHHRPVRRGQIDAGALHQPAGAPDQRRGLGRRAEPHGAEPEGAAAGAAADRHDLPGLSTCWSSGRCCSNVGLSRWMIWRGTPKDAGPEPGPAELLGLVGLPGQGAESYPSTALRRAEAAGGHRPGSVPRAPGTCCATRRPATLDPNTTRSILELLRRDQPGRWA